MKGINIKGKVITEEVFMVDSTKGLVNLTVMAKPFKKLPADWLRLAKTKEYLDAYQELKSVMGNPITVVQGGLNQGTWAPKDIALDFAMWLSPKFKVWAIDLLEQILSGNYEVVHVSKQDRYEKFISSRKGTNLAVKEFSVLLEQDGIHLGLKTLFKIFRKKGYLCSRGGVNYNLPTSRANRYGIFHTSIRDVDMKSNRTGEEWKSAKPTVYLTQRGVKLFYKHFISEEFESEVLNGVLKDCNIKITWPIVKDSKAEQVELETPEQTEFIAVIEA